MDGILVIDKPEGITSHDVVARLRRILKTKKIGHTGTLDPFATGVMTVLVGKATRLAQFLDKDEKEYEAVIQFGWETDSGDRTGSPRSKVPSPTSVAGGDLRQLLDLFRGEIEQTPPMYSAKKIEGKKLYELAREGKTVERKAVIVFISKLELIDDDAEPRSEHRILVACSAGTYIRTLAEDIGRKIGVGAHLSELRRTRSGRFEISESIALNELAELPQPEERLLPIETAVEHLANFTLREERIEKTRSGMSTRISGDADFRTDEPIKMTSPAGELIAIGYFDPAEYCIRPKLVLS